MAGFSSSWKPTWIKELSPSHRLNSRGRSRSPQPAPQSTRAMPHFWQRVLPWSGSGTPRAWRKSQKEEAGGWRPPMSRHSEWPQNKQKKALVPHPTSSTHPQHAWWKNRYSPEATKQRPSDLAASKAGTVTLGSEIRSSRNSAEGSRKMKSMPRLLSAPLLKVNNF